MKILLLFGVLLFMLSAFHVKVEGKLEESRIIGGEKVKDIKNFPYTAVLIEEWGHHTTFLCACGKVSRYFALTTARCITPTLMQAYLLGTLTVRGNTKRWKSYGGDDHHVTMVKKNPNYNKTNHDADVAIVKVKTPFERVSWLALPPSGAAYAKDHPILMLGWGTQQLDGLGKVMDDLFYVYLRVEDWDNCKKHFRGHLTTGMFCANSKKKGPCTYDHGGPVQAIIDRRKFMIGLVSYTYNGLCGVGPSSNIFTNLWSYRNWIWKAINNKKHTDEDNESKSDEVE